MPYNGFQRLYNHLENETGERLLTKAQEATLERKMDIYTRILARMRDNDIPGLKEDIQAYCKKHRGQYRDLLAGIIEENKDQDLKDQFNTLKSFLSDHWKSPREIDFFRTVLELLNIENKSEKKYTEENPVAALKAHVVNNNYELAKKLLMRFKDDWNDPKHHDAYTEARLLRKAVQNQNPQMIALLLKFNIPDYEDKHHVTGEMLAKGEESTKTVKGKLLNESKQLSKDLSSKTFGLFDSDRFFGEEYVNRCKSPTCLGAFDISKKYPEIKEHPLFFVIENYFRQHTYEEKDKKYQEKLQQFMAILDIFINKKANPQAEIKAYIDKNFKPGKSEFRETVKALLAWDNDELKENFKAYKRFVKEANPADEDLKALVHARLEKQEISAKDKPMRAFTFRDSGRD